MRVLHLLRYEVYKHLRNPWLWMVAFGLISFCILFTSVGGIYTAGELASRYENMSVDTLRRAFSVEGGETLDEVIALILNSQFPNVFWQLAAALGFFGFIFGPFFLCKDFTQRTITQPLSIGFSKGQVFVVKLVVYHGASLLAGVILLWIMLSFYAPNWRTLEPAYAWRNIGVFLMCWTAEMSVSLWVCFAVRRPLIAGGIMFVFMMVNFGVPFHPIYILRTRVLWETAASPEIIRFAVGITTMWIVAGNVLSWLFFRRMEWK